MGKSDPKVGIIMHQVATIDQAKGRIKTLQVLEARNGCGKGDALHLVARKARVPAGTLTNILKGRVKSVAADVAARLQAAVVTELQREIKRLNHELELAKAGFRTFEDFEIAEVEAHIEAAKRLLRGR
jgi:hypothetical protein